MIDFHRSKSLVVFQAPFGPMYTLVGVFLLAMFLDYGWADNGNIPISWSNLTVSIRENGGHYRSILKMDYPATVEPGRLLGIIGPSGAGKSTFLNVLSGRMRQSSMFAKALASESLIVSDLYPTFTGRDVAFIHQDDSFFTMLSVVETLALASQLRLPSEDATFQRLASEDAISAMALIAVKDSQVGDPLGKRGISGGERKRLSVACELLSKPRVLIADEPTSGLDSYQALSVVSKLKKTVVDRGIVGVATLHQPRSSIYALIDDLLLLAPGGQVVYHGPRENVLSYFSKLDFPCPSNTNPAEHMIDLVSIDYTSSDATEESKARIEHLTELFSDSKKKEGLASQSASAARSVEARSVEESNGAVDGAANGVGKARVTVLRRLSLMRAAASVGRSCRRFSLLLGRALRQTLRDAGTNLVRFGVSALLAWVIGTLYGHQGPDITEASVGSRVTIIAQAAIQVSMLTMIKTLQLFKRERPVVGRELASRQYFSVEYLLAKLLSELPMDAMVATVFGAVLHKRTDLSSPMWDFVSTLALLGCASSSLGLAVGALSPTADIALAVGPALMVVYVIMGAIGPSMGGQKELPPYLTTLRAASPIRPACESMCFAEFKDQSFISPSNRGPIGGLRAVLSNLPHILRVLIRRDKAGAKPSLSTPGDHVLDDLGIDVAGSSFSQARQSLVKMLVAHSAMALVGLFFTRYE